MDLDEIAKAFRGVAKGPTRAFARSTVDGAATYSLPNGISIFEWEEGMEFSVGKVFERGGACVEVLEISDGFVIVRDGHRSSATRLLNSS